MLEVRILMFDISYKKMNLKKIQMLFILMLCIISIQAQSDVFTRIRSNTQEVFVKQPVKVSITVYTATWFTQPLDMATLQVANAFVLPFKRTQSAIQYVKKKKYATLEFFYLIFPYQSGELIIPALDIIATSPPEGDYKGQRITLKTKPITIKVKTIPAGVNDQNWLVATNAAITAKWNRPLTNLKVGDLIERTITIHASGTLPAFIPPLQMDHPEWAGIYPHEPELKDTRTNTGANGILIQRYRYLLSKEGTFKLDPVSISWWNPHLQKKYSRETQATSLTVSPNSDLGIVATMRDSLSLTLPANELVQEDSEILILGLTIYQFATFIFFVCIMTLLLVLLIKRLLQTRKKKKEAYQNSERYYYHQLLKALENGHIATLNALYIWLLSLHQENYTIESIKPYLANISAAKELNGLLESIFSDATTMESLSKSHMEQLHKALLTKSHFAAQKLPPLNP